MNECFSKLVKLLAMLNCLAQMGLLSASDAERTAHSDRSQRTVIVFGDSITAGGALPSANRDKAWIRVVERESGGRLKMINEGKGGRPSASTKEFDDMLSRQPKADVLVLALGTNDSRDITPECVPKAVTHLRYMVDKARQTYGAGLSVLIVGPPNINKAALGPTKGIANEREAKLKELGEGFSKLAADLHCGYISLFGAVPETSMTKDGVHPDPTGNEAIAKVILRELLKNTR